MLYPFLPFLTYSVGLFTLSRSDCPRRWHLESHTERGSVRCSLPRRHCGDDDEALSVRFANVGGMGPTGPPVLSKQIAPQGNGLYRLHHLHSLLENDGYFKQAIWDHRGVQLPLQLEWRRSFRLPHC